MPRWAEVSRDGWLVSEGELVVTTDVLISAVKHSLLSSLANVRCQSTCPLTGTVVYCIGSFRLRILPAPQKQPFS